MSDSLQPHRLSPTRLLCPWDFSAKHSGVGCHFLFHCLFGKIHDKCCSSQKTAETWSWNQSRTRGNYPRNLVNFRMESRSFKGDRCDIHIDFLDFTSQRVWKEDLSSSDRISTDNPRDGWTLVVFSPSIPLLIEVPGPGPLFCLGMTATCLWQLGSSVMTDSHPAKGQSRSKHPSLIRLLMQRQGKKILSFCLLWLLPSSGCIIMSPRRERSLSRASVLNLGGQTAVPSEAKINCTAETVLAVQWLVSNYRPVVRASGAPNSSVPIRHSGGEGLGVT